MVTLQQKVTAQQAPLFNSATRMSDALTSRVEKRALIWMAERMPARISSDHLTILGFAAQFLAGVCYAAAHWSRWALLLVNVCIALNWFGDSLDGTLARVRGQQRPRYGFYVDHVIDTFGATFMMSGLALSGYLHWQVALAMLVAFLVLSVETYLATYTLGRFHMSHGLFGPTEIRILLVIGNTVLIFRPYAHLLGRQFLLYDIGGVIAAAGMFAMATVAAVRHTRELYRQERLP